MLAWDHYPERPQPLVALANDWGAALPAVRQDGSATAPARRGDSPRGGETASRLLSLVATCRRLHMDSFLYLRDVFTRLPGLPPSRLDELLPDRWLAVHPEARYPPECQSHGHGDRRPRRRHSKRP
jgi:hypothetical protein